MIIMFGDKNNTQENQTGQLKKKIGIKRAAAYVFRKAAYVLVLFLIANIAWFEMMSIAQLIGSLTEEDPYMWYIGRASGIGAFILFTLVVINGLLISTRLSARIMSPAVNYEMHKFLAWTALLLLLLHIASLSFDKFINLSFVEIFIPFTFSRDFKTALGFDVGIAVALGIIAFYLLVMLVFTSQWRARLPYKVWRKLHYASFAAYLLFTFHGIMTGTDSGEWWMIWIYGISWTIVAALIGFRIQLSLRPK